MSSHNSHWRLLAVATVAVLGAWTVLAQTQSDPLLQGFQNPPDSAKPRVWWHWMNGNVTKQGITLDFEWMKRTPQAKIIRRALELTQEEPSEKRA
jgi:hypothetical protein